jgi:large subunit ribosomal protein L5e
MGFVKIVKNTAYFKRFQVKFARRRQNKTDYYARQRLVTQDKNKYKTPKYRLVVRITNKDVICQIFAADLTHDVCMAAAYAHELPRYGLKHGLTNYAAAYCTGLLLARRVNKKYNLEYKGNTEVDGNDFNVEAEEGGKAPFKALLDVGLARTTTGARIFGALKGACDGGIDVPHKDRRFPGSKRGENKEWESDPETHRKYIFGGHVGDWMKAIAEDDDKKESVKQQFKKFQEAGIDAGKLEAMYAATHKAIRADPTKKRDGSELGYFKKRKAPKAANPTYPKKTWGLTRRSKQQVKATIRQKLTAKGVVPVKNMEA